MQSRDGEYNLFEHAQGDGAGRVTLSEAAAAAGHVLDDCRVELDAIRRRFRGRPGGPENTDPPERAWIDAETGHSRKRARAVAAKLEAAAGALRNASEPGGPPFRHKR